MPTLHQHYLYRGYLQIVALDLTRSNAPALWLLHWDPTQPVATRPLSLRKNGTWYTYGHDLTKNVMELYKADGTIATAYDYTPYGTVTASGIDQPIQWSSEHYDPELALVYYNYRHYNPTDGRWINRDPIAEEGGRNLYGFVGNNVMDLYDFLGLIEAGDREYWGFANSLTEDTGKNRGNCWRYVCNDPVKYYSNLERNKHKIEQRKRNKQIQNARKMKKKEIPSAIPDLPANEKERIGPRKIQQNKPKKYTCSTMKNAVLSQNKQILVTSESSECPCGFYKVELVVKESDFHFYRQDNDKTWSHKPGLNPLKTGLKDKAREKYSFDHGYKACAFFCFPESGIDAD